MQKVSDYASIYARIMERQIDTNIFMGACYFPMFRWANTYSGIAITTTGMVGVFNGVNKNVTIYQFKCNIDIQ